jgi:transposase-like protein
VWGLVEAWQSRPLAAVYPIIYLDAIHINLRQNGKVDNTAVYVVLGVDVEGHRDVLGHWIGNGAETANFWLSLITDLQGRGVRDIFIFTSIIVKSITAKFYWTRFLDERISGTKSFGLMIMALVQKADGLQNTTISFFT